MRPLCTIALVLASQLAGAADAQDSISRLRPFVPSTDLMKRAGVQTTLCPADFATRTIEALPVPDADVSAYLYGVRYAWLEFKLEQDGAICVLLLHPERRLLDPEEALILFMAAGGYGREEEEEESEATLNQPASKTLPHEIE